MTIYNDINYIEHFDELPMRTDATHAYRRYRMGRLKHQIWLNNRKKSDSIVIDTYDAFITRNIQKGETCIFGSAGYYMDDLIPNLTVVEQHEVVKRFYPSCVVIKNRSEISKIFGRKFNNFVVNNNRGDVWVENGPTEHCIEYSKSMNESCLFFYSFRDTQIIFNRFNNQYDHFYNWELSLKDICDLHLIWHDIKFIEDIPMNKFNMMENPDTTNGNLKFVFQYKSNSSIIV